MFTGCTTASVEETFLKSFSQPGGTFQVVKATIAGMELDCPYVHKLIHLGPATDIEQYVQETGRVGRDGLPSVAILYVTDFQAHQTEIL